MSWLKDKDVGSMSRTDWADCASSIGYSGRQRQSAAILIAKYFTEQSENKSPYKYLNSEKDSDIESEDSDVSCTGDDLLERARQVYGIKSPRSSSSQEKDGIRKVKKIGGERFFYFALPGLNEGRETIATDEYMQRYHADLVHEFLHQ